VLPFRTEADATERLRKIEAAHDLFAHTFDGHCAWRLLRFGAGIALQNLPISRASQAPAARWRRLGSSFAQALRDLPRALFPGRARYVVKTFGSALGERLADGRYRDVYFDDLFEGLPARSGGRELYFKLLSGFSARRSLAHLPVAMTTAAVDLVAAVASRFAGPRDIPAAAAIAAAVSSEPCLEYLTPTHVARHLRHFYWSKRMYRWLLRRLGASWLLVGDTGEFAAWAGAREAGVRSAEFQHGIFTPDHPDLVPAGIAADARRGVMPDRVFLYGEHWKQALAAAGATSPAFVAVGSPRIDRYRRIRAAHARAEASCRVVVTTQGFEPGPLAAFLAEALRDAEGAACEVAIKLHPLYDRDGSGYREAFADRPSVTVLTGSEEPNTFELLARADVHLSISSACHYDALGLGVPTIVVPLPSHEIVLPLVSAGHAHLAATPRELAALIAGWRSLAVSRDVSEYYFRPGAVEAIRTELELMS
jgi:hypothetical protein